MTNQLLQLTWSNKDLALIPTETGKYGYRWVSPSDPRYCETHTLEISDHVVGSQTPKEDGVTYSELADLAPTDDNLLILGESGDVLEALTRVPELADKYAGQIKCIYIDPPFNTAQAFTNYEDNLQHSVWLTMMRDRLQHMHTLLSADGSIWVHLDDVENHRMRVLLDEVFGPENFVAEVIWQKVDGPRNDAALFSSDHDTIMVYRKSLAFEVNRLPRSADMNARFSNPDNDPEGAWAADNPCGPNAATHQGMVYAIEHPITGDLMYPSMGRCWAESQDAMLSHMQGWAHYELRDIDDAAARARVCGIPPETVRENVSAIMLAEPLEIAGQKARRLIDSGEPMPRLIFTKGGLGRVMRKSRIPVKGQVPRTIWFNEDVSHNRGAVKEQTKLFPGVTPFKTPKPERLLERVLHIATNPGDIVLDVFAGSGTTAAVAQKMGRRWVTCELQEDNFTQFTRPRLEKVVRGEDHGGITTSKGERVPAAGTDLPEGMSAEDAQKFTSLLNKLVRDDDDLKKCPQVKALKALSKTTKTPDTVNWRGGGGFTVARLSPECFDYDETLGLTLLTDAATGDTLINSVAANLNFHHTPDDPVFHGIRGCMRLVVVEGTLLTSRVDELLAELADGELLTIATTEPDEAIRSHLRQVKRGCRMVHIPDDIFHPTTAAGLLADDTVQEA